MKLPTTLKNEADAESYEYFDKNVRSLPKGSSGKIDSKQKGFNDNDVDAFRHAYVSGVLTQQHGETTADILGRINELELSNSYSNSRNPGSRNMDLWNNAIGRKYGVKSKDRQSLAENLLKVLKNAELITEPKDKRRYKGASHNPASKEKPVVVL